MGSTGTGRFGDYRETTASSNPGKNGSNGNNNYGTKSGTKLELIKLEEVALSEYYVTHQHVIDVNENVRIREKLLNGRLVVECIETTEVIGLMPTKYNYLYVNKNINKFNYLGIVVASGEKPIPYTVVTLNVSKK